MTPQTFEQWTAEIARLVFAEYRMHLEDLMDVPLYDTWEDGLTPSQAFDLFMEEYWQ